MASPISPPTPFTSPTIFSDSNLNFHSCATFSFNSPFLRKPNLIPSISISKPQNSSFCCCRSSSSDSPSPSPSSSLQQFLVAAAQAVEDFVNSRFSPKKDEVVVREKKSEESGNLEVDVNGWDWERWSLHFKEVEEQERLINLLKSQLRHAIEKEDYEAAARLKVAIAAAGTKDAVGSVMCYLKNAIEEERYQDAVFVRDNAGAGLVGWWAGVSDDRNDPHGCIIRISAEHGRYVARSYSPRQLATSTAGAPLFEIYVTLNKEGDYRQQAVYLKRKAVPETFPSVFPKSPAAPGSMKMSPGGGKTDIFTPVLEDTDDDDEDKDDPELADGLSGFQNLLQDMIPGVRVKVLKVTAPGKVDRDLISKVVEQIIEEEDEDQDIEAELNSIDTEDTDDDIPGESDEEKDDNEDDPTSSDLDKEEQSEIAVNVVVSGLVENLSSTTSSKDLVRVPAKLKSKGHKSFSFCIQDDKSKPESVTKGQTSSKRKANAKGRRSIDHVMSDLVNSISRGEKIPVKVLKDVGDLISLTLNQVQNRQPLSGSTTFNRIDLPSYPDPLNGLYIGSHGPYTSEVIQLKRKFGQWKEDGGSKGPSNLQFYEYVEAVKLTGDPYVPAGQVAFRAKIGKSYQLPHKGIIPEEFGVVARYKGQGRLAEPGFRNPRWVDGELVILDGKYIKGGPVVGFVYWAPEYQFLVFFNRLRIEE
ncbi:protein EXECUTER 1, chloroplastic-like [Chenopodium quinoa]|uniref:protein EXECUTER 1, chloroplastic-like n=1 Tax=Chenopodium quinoa TaxID=63459 RepID=UPI000B7975A9|nr:protein EXECUTER 1, chloroplastic-like [Chenopodium quinoa]XP_021773994.1 protein EXECUTER 1, chloroplastic-like [Chenopodium quinoa]